MEDEENSSTRRPTSVLPHVVKGFRQRSTRSGFVVASGSELKQLIVHGDEEEGKKDEVEEKEVEDDDDDEDEEDHDEDDESIGLFRSHPFHSFLAFHLAFLALLPMRSHKQKRNVKNKGRGRTENKRARFHWKWMLYTVWCVVVFVSVAGPVPYAYYSIQGHSSVFFTVFVFILTLQPVLCWAALVHYFRGKERPLEALKNLTRGVRSRKILLQMMEKAYSKEESADHNAEDVDVGGNMIEYVHERGARNFDVDGDGYVVEDDNGVFVYQRGLFCFHFPFETFDEFPVDPSWAGKKFLQLRRKHKFSSIASKKLMKRLHNEYVKLKAGVLRRDGHYKYVAIPLLRSHLESDDGFNVSFPQDGNDYQTLEAVDEHASYQSAPAPHSVDSFREQKGKRRRGWRVDEDEKEADRLIECRSNVQDIEHRTDRRLIIFFIANIILLLFFLFWLLNVFLEDLSEFTVIQIIIAVVLSLSFLVRLTVSSTAVVYFGLLCEHHIRKAEEYESIHTQINQQVPSERGLLRRRETQQRIQIVRNVLHDGGDEDGMEFDIENEQIPWWARIKPEGTDWPPEWKDMWFGPNYNRDYEFNQVESFIHYAAKMLVHHVERCSQTSNAFFYIFIAIYITPLVLLVFLFLIAFHHVHIFWNFWYFAPYTFYLFVYVIILLHASAKVSDKYTRVRQRVLMRAAAKDGCFELAAPSSAKYYLNLVKNCKSDFEILGLPITFQVIWRIVLLTIIVAVPLCVLLFL
eukprot:TRINITY_DN960_c1_g1_i1.p1 TRINITY_DN960_c1_g1~~TRINITY_DN960_c1_g1_i1.p1  ORF type:complete len:766 (+),score=188.67 TRINITY_DN960_c1_g1_i1:61-2298(+)